MKVPAHRFLALLLVACGPLPIEPAGDAAVSPPDPVDAAGIADDLPPQDVPWDGGTDGPIPRIRITSPAGGSTIDSEQLRIEGGAADDEGVASVLVRIGPNEPLPAQTRNGFRTFSVEGVAPVGTFEVEAIARDLEGNLSEPARITLVRSSTASDEEPPSIEVSSPADGESPPTPLVLVQGTASDDRAVVAVEVERNGEALDERPVETSDLFATWSRLVPLLPGQENELVFTAIDASGQRTSATLTLLGRATSDRTPPVLAITAPAEDAVIDGPTLTLEGSAADAAEIREVKVRVGRPAGGSGEIVFGEYRGVETSTGYAMFTADLRVPTGVFEIEVIAIDLNGLSSVVTRRVTNELVPDWTEEVAIPLRLHDQTQPVPLEFTLDRAGIDEVFSADIQRDTNLLELDTTTLITDAVAQIKTSCGTLWRQNNPNPRHDCSGTDYGADRDPPIPWQQTPEYSMVRLLTMTPANVVVDGTSLENLEGVADALEIGGGFRQILAETLGIGLTDEIVPTDSVVQGLQTFWMEPHPQVAPGARLPITLYDAMNDLAPLADRFGARGDHPGLLDPEFPPRSELLTEAFEMRLIASSNLRWLDGVDAADAGGDSQKDYIALVFDATGPSFDDVLEFDFSDPERFEVVGLVEQPRVDLSMLLRENPEFIRTCTNRPLTCRGNLPDDPVSGYVWELPRHQIEPVVTAAALYTYEDREDYSETYRLLGISAATVTMGDGLDPAGWTTFDTLIDLGDPPPPQYIWETISEVAQVALHNYGNTTLEEGEVNVGFTLRDVDVGLTADQLRAAIRPRLQEQRAKLSEQLLGDYRKNNGTVDFYYRRGADDVPYLFFVAPGDPLPDDDYGYTTPGFFADAALTQKLSTQEAGTSGDSEHEKLEVSSGERTIYFADAADQVFRLRVVADSDLTEIEVFLSQQVP